MTSPQSLVPPEREPMRKVWLRYGIVSAGLVVTMLILLFISWPEPYLEYVERSVLPKYEKPFGFRGGRLATSVDSSIYAIVKVEPDGLLERAGVRSGDIPYEHDGSGMGPFYDALQEARAGREGAFLVISDRNDYYGKGARRIVLKPEGRVQ